MILALGTPIVIMLAIGMLFGNVTGLWALAWILVGAVVYGVLVWLIVGLPQMHSQPSASDATGTVERVHE